MNTLKNKIKRRYILFISTIVIIIIAAMMVIQNNINNQKQIAVLINKTSELCLLNKRISNLVFYFNNNLSSDSINSLKTLTDDFENAQNHLYSLNKHEEDHSTLDSLLKVSDSYLKTIVTSSKNIIANPVMKLIEGDITIITETESPYFLTMQTALREYQKSAKESLNNLKTTVYLLALATILMLIGIFLFILVPVVKQLLQQNKKLKNANNEQAKSERKIKENISELTRLKTDLEAKEAYNKIFIEQAPIAIAMVDNNMCYLAVSQRWITDYKMEGKEFIGRSHYDLFPEIGEKWKEMHQRCLKGAIDVNKETSFIRADGSLQWIHWDVRPWYDSAGNIGGILMQTEDITSIKANEDDKIRIEKILDKTNEVARIGTWEVDLLKNKVFWSKMVCEIHEVPEGYIPDLEKSINFYKEGKSRDTIARVVKEAIENGIPYDVEVEIETAKGTNIWTRAIGQVEFIDGKCARFFGVFQDVNNIKISQIALNKAHTELKAIFNSGAVGIVATEINGIISQFNHGAEILTGYSASEIIGLQRPRFYHLQEELDAFRIDIAKQYSKNPIGFSALLELSKHNAYDTREWTYLKKDGSLIPVQLTLTSIKDDQGELIGYLGVSTDTSEKKIAQNELLRKNKLLNFAEAITLMGNWQWDTVEDKVEWSDNLFNIFKLDREIECISFDTYFNFVHPDDKEIVTDYFDQTRNEKRLKKFTHRIIAGDGKLKYIQLLGEVITNDKNEVVEMIGTCQDITATKVAEKELFDALTQLKAIFNSGPLAIVSVDNEGVINNFNRGAEHLLGYSASEMIGLKQPEIYHLEEELSNFKEDIAKKYDKDLTGFSPYLELAKNDAFDTREWTFRNKDGSTFPVELTLTAIKNEQGEKLGFLAVANDISDRKRVQNDLIRKNQLLNFAEKIIMMGNWQWDLFTNKVKWSTNLYNIFGVKENTDITYDTYFSFVHPEDKEKVTDKVEKSIHNKKIIDLMHRITLTNGTVKTIQLLAEVLKDNKGNVIEMIGTCQDVTTQRMAENKFRGLLESAPDAMVIVNEEGKIQLINKQSEKLFGYSAEELFRKPVEILIPGRFTGNHKVHQGGFFSNPKVRTMGIGKELFGINKAGIEIPIQISLSPLQTEEGLLVSAAIRDITVQKKAEKKILEAKASLEILANKLTDQNIQLADFAHITSHNLRAPVSNLNALLDFYKAAESESERIDLFEKFETVINHLTETLNTLIEALKTKNEDSKNIEMLTFSEILNKIKEILSGQILKTDTKIISDFSKNPNIKYNRVYLESIFLNLVSNAIKYKAKNRTPEIFIHSIIENGVPKLKFKDNGLGINLERHGHKIFGLNKVFHRHPDAKGVGLFMTKTQVESMGGKISVESEVNVGSTFSINFNV
ncbi:PAS domain S-box protein [Bizionia argentinensis JUB59]|uniref:histidine kinase n=1 Tax=Bizionia argentinensis JUB59 TaxID=1046627 RepID=G2EA24_9FLAO|nr:PAS domain S-box protein [Bizionia argentinensis]EGV44729.1 PAS domain S-box protein [Bizionia argentinensis JUB59]